MTPQFFLQKQEERFAASDLIARRATRDGCILACSSDKQLCQIVGQALTPHSPTPLYCAGTQRPHGILIGPLRWQALCLFVKNLPDVWCLENNAANIPPNAEIIAFVRAFIRQEVLLRPDSSTLISSPIPSDDVYRIASRAKRIERARNPFWVHDVGGNKWPHYDFALPNDESSSLPIENWFETWQQSLRGGLTHGELSSDDSPLLRRLNSGEHIPAEQIFGNYQGRTSERRTSNLDE